MFRNTYTFSVGMEHKFTVAAILEKLNIKKYRLLVDDHCDIIVDFNANRKECNQVVDKLKKYMNVQAYVA